MKTKRLPAAVATTLLLAVAAAPSASARPDPTTGTPPVDSGAPNTIVVMPADGESGFDWNDAAIGATVALSAAALAAGTARFAHQHRTTLGH